MTHQWAFPQVIAMAVSVAVMFPYFLGCSFLSWDYYGKVTVMFSTGQYWFLGVLTAPLFTAVLVDGTWHAIRYAFFPTPEMLMQEMELKTLFAGDDGNNLKMGWTNLLRCGSMAAHNDNDNNEGSYGRSSSTGFEPVGDENPEEGSIIMTAIAPGGNHNPQQHQEQQQHSPARKSSAADAEELIFAVGTEKQSQERRERSNSRGGGGGGGA
jgi:hypothetical protein